MYYSHDKCHFKENLPDYGQKNAVGWKTINGYINEAKKLACCLFRNNCQLTHHVVISFDAPLSEQEHKQYWSIIARRLKLAKVVAFYIRELNEAGDRIHYHLLIATIHEALRDTIRNALPDAIKNVSRVHVERIRDQWAICYYVTKAKTSGFCKITGKYTSDLYRSKRHIFAKECKLKKCGTIGKFWFRSRKAIWQSVIKQERAIASFADDESYEQSRQIYDLVDGWASRRTIERTICHFRWLETLSVSE